MLRILITQHKMKFRADKDFFLKFTLHNIQEKLVFKTFIERNKSSINLHPFCLFISKKGFSLIKECGPQGIRVFNLQKKAV